MRKQLRDLASGSSDDGLSRRHFIAGTAAVGAAAGLSGAGSAQTEAATEFVLDGGISGWVGQSPQDIGGETNPTLEFPAGETITVTWENVDGAPHNFAVLDADGNELVASEIITGTDRTQTVEFTATEEMEEYYCAVHPSTMLGDVSIVTGDGDDGDEGDDGDGDEQPTASVTFDDQTTDESGAMVTVQSTSLSQGGFVVVHDASSGAVLGVSEKLDAGSHEDVGVSLFGGVPGAEFDQSALEEERDLLAMPHLDTNDNGSFDFLTDDGTDGPYVTDEGNPVTDQAAVSPPAPTADVVFDNQSTNGTTVTVQSVSMSEGGFVAIHDASLLDGAVLDSVVGVSEKLDAGTHEDVECTLYEVPGGDFDVSSLPSPQTLIAMPHRDTNENDTYDFLTSEGQSDGPYVTEEGDAVVDDADISC